MKRGRKPVSLDEAREFARLVEQERKPGEKLDPTVFLRIRRREPKRWGSTATMWRRWCMAKQELPEKLTNAQRLAQLREKMAQAETLENRLRDDLRRRIARRRSRRRRPN